ncbi:MAG TPA: hypothetical protein VEU30_03125, partial [Thermoanaerobaculia bacterium]|nr:hypothetical protein [Thermoanaerobaculia bacterium]
IKSLQPLHELPVDAGTNVPTYMYARDAQFEYLATPNGLYRAPRLATSVPQRIAFEGEAVHAVAVNEGALYVAKGAVNEAATHPEHTLLRSDDHGATFVNIDAALLDCALQPCAYLVPTRMSFAPDRMFVNAGGNVLASDDDGASWHQLYGLQSNGKPTAQVCPVKFELVGTQLFLGGECPLDVAWLHRGTLRPNLLEWADDPRPVTAPEMENRNIQFIRDLGAGVLFVGIEGALLKSTGGGESFRYVLHYDLEAVDRYPYIGNFAVSSRDPRVMLLGGFDKKNDVGYLAYSGDGGETWQDVSGLVGEPYVSLLTEDAEGRMLIGLQDKRGTFTLAEVVLSEPKKRRAVR